MTQSEIQYYNEHIYDVIGALYNVQKGLGLGLNEYCYQEALQLEFIEQQIPFAKEVVFHPTYHNKVMKTTIRADFVCKDDIIVECKAVEEILPIHQAQLFSYMRIAQAPCGILVNFGQPGRLHIERYLYDTETKRILTINGIIIK